MEVLEYNSRYPKDRKRKVPYPFSVASDDKWTRMLSTAG
jgi:hypothetical protein